MAYEQRPNNGTLFANKSKTKPNSPDYSGTLTIDVNSLEVVNGVANVRIAGWKKQGSSGSTFLSLSISNMQQSGSSQSTQSKSMADLDDDIPF